MTTRHKKSRHTRRYSLLGIVLITVIVFAVIARSSSSHIEHQAADARNLFASDFQGGRLNTPEAFQSRCREADSSKQTDAGKVLYYESADVYVTFPQSGGPILESESLDSDPDGKIKVTRTPASPVLVFDVLGCS